jgi:hypothetical protein
MASNRGHLDRYGFSNLLVGFSFILNHNFVRCFGSLLDLLIDALDGPQADGPVLLARTQRLRVTARYALAVLRSR